MDGEVSREVFLEKLNALIAGKRKDNSFYFSQEKYSKILSEVVSAKIKCNTPLHYRRLKRFDVLKIDDEDKLIVPLKPGKKCIQFYVTNEELFNILHETHMGTGHGGRARMLKELQLKYKNITYEIVTLYLSLCKQCQVKHSAPKKRIVEKPMVTSELFSICQIDLIDMESNKDGEYKFIMVYQDHITNFVQLRPLKTKTPEEVAHHVLSIFLAFGAPAIMRSNNGRKFSSQVIAKIRSMWKDIRMVHGKSCDSQTQDSIAKVIQNMVTSWMNENDTNKWSGGLPFVQFAKNTAYNEGLGQSPYEAMFGIEAKRGLASFLPSEQMANIETEEQLEEIANTFETFQNFGLSQQHIY